MPALALPSQAGITKVVVVMAQAMVAMGPVVEHPTLVAQAVVMAIIEVAQVVTLAEDLVAKAAKVVVALADLVVAAPVEVMVVPQSVVQATITSPCPRSLL